LGGLVSIARTKIEQGDMTQKTILFNTFRIFLIYIGLSSVSANEVRPNLIALDFIPPTQAATSEPFQYCKDWGPAVLQGELPRQPIDEASGLAVSSRFDRLYHINDSGDDDHLYITDRKGQNPTMIRLKGQSNKDSEDLALADCPRASGSSTKPCIYIADIGDNKLKRKRAAIRIYPEPNRELELFPMHELEFTYTDGPHNAEAFMVHPNGNWYILTKEDNSAPKSKQAKLFWVSAKDVQAAIKGDKLVFKLWAEIDVADITGQVGLSARVTGASMHPSGTRFLVITYSRVVEFLLNPAQIWPSSSHKKDIDYRLLSPQILLQQEAIAYDRDQKSFFYTSEAPIDTGSLMKVSCSVF
jgi:hypothetical protein